MRGLLLLNVVVFGAAAASAVPGVGVAGLGPVGRVLAFLVYGGSVGLCLLRGYVVRADRWAWLVLGTGLACYAAGGAYLALFPGPAGWQLGGTVAEAARLAIYPSAYLAGALLLRTQVRFLASMWVDGVLGALGACGLAAAVLAAGGSSGSDLGLRSVLALVHLSADLLLLALLIGLLPFLHWRPQRMWWLFGAGLALFAAADFAELAGLAVGGEGAGAVLLLLPPAAVLLLGVAAWQPVREVAPAPLVEWSVYVVPGMFTLSAVGLLLYAAVRPMPLIVAILAAATLLAAIGRAGMTVAEVRALGDARRQAFTDELTGLANRRSFYARLTALLRSAPRPSGLAVLVVDLDGFKEVNDSYGHRVGDDLLRIAGVRLSRGLPPDALLARLGGDEFALVLPGADEPDALDTAARLLAGLQAPVDLDVAGVGRAVSVHVQASVGVALYPAPGASVDSLLQRADIAMYRAKRAGCGVSVYRAKMDQQVRRRLETVEALRAALEVPEQLVVAYQPQVCLATGRVVGLEALVRWQHPQRGLLLPEEFLPLAEASGLMPGLTRHVLRTALADYVQWYRTGSQALLSVNVSASDLRAGHLAHDVSAGLRRLEVPPGRLVLEITEDVLLHDFVATRRVLAEIRQTGVQVAIDDYGTGYSSLSYLRTLSVDQLKLDQSFVADLPSNGRSAAIVRSTVQLAHSLGMSVVAEGVENHQVCQLLAGWDCDVGQGYHFDGALPADLVLPALAPRSYPAGTGSGRVNAS